MNRRQLVRAVAAHAGKDPREVDEVLGATTDVITAVAAQGEAVTIQGFAKFAVANRAARMGRNPRTGEQIRIKASKRVRITPMKALKEQALAPRTAPRLARGVWPTDPELLSRQAQERRTGATTDARGAGAAKKAATKKAVAKKAATKKAVAKKAATRAAGRSTAKTTATKRGPATKKASTKRAPAKKGVAKRGTSRR